MRNLGMPGASLALRRRSAFTPGYGELGGQQDGAACGADEVSMADLTSSRRRVENEPQCGRRDQLTRLGRRAVAGSPAPLEPSERLSGPTSARAAARGTD